MKKPLLKNINQSQEDYFQLLIQYKTLIEDKECKPRNIAMLMDDIKCFWFERLNIIEFEVETLTEAHQCFLLSGAIYLDVSEFEPYYYKSLGEYHFLFDPLLKLEGIFRLQDNYISTETIDYFKKVYRDTIEILTSYRNIFYILPIREIAIDDNDKHQETLKQIFNNIISSLFDSEIMSEEDFCNKYSSFEQIEENINSNVKMHLVFSDLNSPDSTLREKIENYVNSQMNLRELTNGKSESQIFLISIFSWFSQILDILLICLMMRLIPYIRFSITFHYLMLIMPNILEDKTLKEMIEKTIIFYIFTRAINNEFFKAIEFSDYYQQIQKHNLLQNILNSIRERGIDIFEGGLKNIESIILNEFSTIIQ
jgi:hypothetical protein